MDSKEYKFKFSRRMKISSALYLTLFVVLALSLFALHEGGYLSAWLTGSILAIIILMALSIPRKIHIDDQSLRIDSLMDITEVKIREIASVRRIDKREMKGFVPLLGGCGFFGFYGHWIDVIQVERVKIYATEWDNFVEITDIYESRLYLSCSEPDSLVEQIESRIASNTEV